jgi:hypothetical protein
MLTYLRRDGERPRTGWARIAAFFKPGTGFVEGHELPQDFAERRLNQRVFSHWEDKRPSDGFPSPGDIRAEELGDDWENCYILDAGGDHGYPKFDYLGRQLARFSGVFLSGRKDWNQTVLDKATEQVSKVLRTRGPVLCDDELTLFDGRRLLFRSVLLPLSADGSSITHLLGAANGKLCEA